MNKRLIFSLLAALPTVGFASGANVSGFADITYTNDNDMSVFKANAEVDISNKLSDKVSVYIDTDLAITDKDGSSVDGPADSAVLEQAYFALTAMEGITVIGGVFNNPIGWEKEDAPDMYQITHGQIYGILDEQTALYGNNIAGVAVAADAAGVATITVAVLNDIGHNDLEKNSFALVANLTAVENLDVELGYVTQEKGPGSAENVLNLNATYMIKGATIGVEFLSSDEIVDAAYGGTVNYAINDMFNVTGRYDSVSFKESGKDDKTSYTLAGTYNVASNLAVLAEFTSIDDGKNTDDMVMLEFIALF